MNCCSVRSGNDLLLSGNELLHSGNELLLCTHIARQYWPNMGIVSAQYCDAVNSMKLACPMGKLQKLYPKGTEHYSPPIIFVLNSHHRCVNNARDADDPV
jgi:hypothetical protein